MASSINASTSGAGGVITTADNTGILNIQSAGTTVAAIASTGMAVTGTLSASGAATLSSTLGVTGNLSFNSGYGSSAVAYGCRAWVNFNGTGTVAIRGSGNVTSITDNGVGDYTVNMTNAMPDVNYSSVACCNYDNAGGMTDASIGNQTAASCRVISHDIAGGTKYDLHAMNVSIFR